MITCYYGLRMCVVVLIRIYTFREFCAIFCCFASMSVLLSRPRLGFELSASCLASSSKKLTRVYHCKNEFRSLWHKLIIDKKPSCR